MTTYNIGLSLSGHIKPGPSDYAFVFKALSETIRAAGGTVIRENTTWGVYAGTVEEAVDLAFHVNEPLYQDQIDRIMRTLCMLARGYKQDCVFLARQADCGDRNWRQRLTVEFKQPLCLAAVQGVIEEDRLEGYTLLRAKGDQRMVPHGDTLFTGLTADWVPEFDAAWGSEALKDEFIADTSGPRGRSIRAFLRTRAALETLPLVTSAKITGVQALVVHTNGYVRVIEATDGDGLGFESSIAAHVTRYLAEVGLTEDLDEEDQGFPTLT